jgi:hypothetical protein
MPVEANEVADSGDDGETVGSLSEAADSLGSIST